MCRTKKICHPEFTLRPPCGCCPCKCMFYFDMGTGCKPTSVANIMKYAKERGQRLLLVPNSTPGEGPVTVSFEDLPKQESVDLVDKPRRSRPVMKRTSNEKITKKPTKRAQTQSERTKARKMKKRQLQHDEIAAKRADMVTSLPETTTKPDTELNVDDAAKVEVKIETVGAPAKDVNKKQRSKTHFRKTKKPGRA